MRTVSWNTTSCELTEGVFFCPDEGVDRRYRLTLDLVEGIDPDNRVECISCRVRYAVGVLSLPTTDQMSAQLDRFLRTAAAAVLRALEAQPGSWERALQVLSGGVSRYGRAELAHDLQTCDPDRLEREADLVAAFLTDAGKGAVLSTCAALAIVDCVIEPRAMRTLERLGATLGLSPEEVFSVLDRCTE